MLGGISFHIVINNFSPTFIPTPQKLWYQEIYLTKIHPLQNLWAVFLFLMIQRWDFEPFAELAVVGLAAFDAWFVGDIDMDLWSFDEHPFDRLYDKLGNAE